MLSIFWTTQEKYKATSELFEYDQTNENSMKNDKEDEIKDDSSLMELVLRKNALKATIT